MTLPVRIVGDRIVLAFEDLRRPGEFEDRFIDAGGFDDTAILGEIAEQHGETAVLRKRMFGAADHAACTVDVDTVVAAGLREGGLGGNASGSRAVEIMHRFVGRLHDVPFCQSVGHGLFMNGANGRVEQPGPVQLTEDCQ